MAQTSFSRVLRTTENQTCRVLKSCKGIESSPKIKLYNNYIFAKWRYISLIIINLNKVHEIRLQRYGIRKSVCVAQIQFLWITFHKIIKSVLNMYWAHSANFEYNFNFFIKEKLRLKTMNCYTILKFSLEYILILTLSLLGYLKTRICWGQIDPPSLNPMFDVQIWQMIHH